MWWVSGDTVKIEELWPPNLSSLVEMLNRHKDVKIALTYSIPCSTILGRTYGEEMNALKNAIQSNPRIVSVDFYTDPGKVQTTTLELAEAIFAFPLPYLWKHEKSSSLQRRTEIQYSMLW